MAEVNILDPNTKLVDLTGLGIFWGKVQEYIIASHAVINNKIGKFTNETPATGICKVIEDNEKVTAEALTDLNARVSANATAIGDANNGIIKDIKAIQDELNSLSGGVGSIQTQISNAIATLDVTDTAVAGQYVSSVSEVDGKVIVTREALPTVEVPEYTIVKNTTGLGSNIKESYSLTKDGSVVGETINIYKDSALQKVEFKEQKLEFTYLLADGTADVVSVDVSAFLAEQEFENGLQVVDGKVSVKIDPESSEYITVSESGIKLSKVPVTVAEEADILALFA
jgi:hypothetical protein